MLKFFKSLIASPDEGIPAISLRVPEGERVYAIGDIHGRLDLFRRMIAMIERDESVRDTAKTTVILLGDLVDRGPDSAGVIAAARDWAARRDVRILAGNHEEMFLDSFDHDETLRHFLRHGGRETLLSYGLTPEDYAAMTLEEIRAAMPALVPAADVAFLRSFEDIIRIGDYVFVHAGIRPGVALSAQNPLDMRWIRGEFIADRTPRDFVVVHGHTICEDPEVHPLRVGIDTGAYASGRLTAIGLEGESRWLIEAAGAPSPTG
jgi:serine/threonine protein phosphatase 1